MRVEWTELASGMLDEAMAYIAQDRPETAIEWLEAILDAASSLADFPEQGRVAPEANREDVRELILAPYRLIYRLEADAVYIALVTHSRRELHEDDFT
jgi:plasmid stabilization system protein ParE